MVYYKLIKAIIDILKFEKVIKDVVVKYYGFLDLIITNKTSFFILNFWSLICYFLDIK